LAGLTYNLRVKGKDSRVGDKKKDTKSIGRGKAT